MDTIQERLDNLSELSEEERIELKADIRAEFRVADKADDFDAMETLARHGEVVTEFEADLAVKEAEAATKAAAEADEEEAEKPAAEEAKVEETKEDPKNPGESVEAITEAEAPASAETESEVPAMAASAVLPEETDETSKEVAPIVASIQAVPFVGQDIKGLTAGTEFRDEMEIATAMTKKIEAIRGTHGGDGEKRTVVSLRASIGEARDLDLTDSIGNMKKIESVLPQSLVASGGYCAPLPVNYDIFGVGTAARPVRDSLPTFAATRGGIRYIAPPLLGAYNSAISLWTAANDANPTSPTKKPSLKVSCAQELTATTDAVTLSLIFGNFMSRAFPELVQRHNQLALIQHARFAERTLLNKISAASTAVTTPSVLGTARDLLLSIAQASAAYRNRHRIPRPVKLRAIMPEWVRDVVREDIATNLNVGTTDIAISDAQVDSWFSSRGLTVTWHIDDTFANQAAGALNAFPTSIKWWLFTEGTFLFLDGGTLDLGVVRDSDLIDTNDYRTFVETFEGIAKVGIEALEITSASRLGPVPPVTTP